MGLIVALSGTAQANWSETFAGGTFDLTTWKFYCYPDMAKTYIATIKVGSDGNHYLSLDESSSVEVGGSAFGTGFGSTEVFTDVRVGAVVNVTGDASRNYCGLAARTAYMIVPAGSKNPLPGIVATKTYVMHVNWEDGPANLRIDIEKVVNMSNIMRNEQALGLELPVPGLGHVRSYYAELDVLGSGPVYVTGSLYQYKGGPLVAKTATMVDTSGNDPWEDANVNDQVFTSGVSGIFGQNENPKPAGYHTTFDDVFSISDGPAAVNPSPVDGTTDVSINADLSWKEAAFATSRQLWFGRKGAMQKVDPAPAGTTFDPGILEYGQNYEWRVDEVGSSSTVTGHTWSFTTADYLSVDNFESYNNDADIESKWAHNIPGGYQYIFCETGKVHEGRKSMRLEYQNQYQPFLTEATLTFDSPQDWTIAGVKTLSLFFRGEDDNVEQRMSIKLEDSVANTSTVVHPYTYAVQSEFWRWWDIALSEFSAGGVNLTAIKKITIAIGDGTSSAQKLDDRDIMYLDDIRLCPPR